MPPLEDSKTNEWHELPSDQWPAEWTHVYFKSYPRLPKIVLPQPAEELDHPLGSVLRLRRSKRSFSPTPLSLEELSALLWHAVAIQDRPAGNSQKEWDRTRRPYPSGGARYPIEIYPVVFRGSASLPAGVYHYNFRQHALEILPRDVRLAGEKHKLFTQPWLFEVPVAFFLTAVAWRSAIKYGEFAFRLTLFEAGHIMQNFYLVSTALGLAGCSFAAFDEKNVAVLLGIYGTGEGVVCGYACGKPEGAGDV